MHKAFKDGEEIRKEYFGFFFFGRTIGHIFIKNRSLKILLIDSSMLTSSLQNYAAGKGVHAMIPAAITFFRLIESLVLFWRQRRA